MPRSGPRAPPASRMLLYHELAELYDRIYDWKDYASELPRLEEVRRRYATSRGRDWLDVACGTGKHLEYLRRSYSVEGVDESPEMLRVARRRLPGIPLHLGDMRRFNLGRKFDVVSCLFSAVGHLPNERGLRAAFRNFARHLKPGGIALVEPWIAPSRYRARGVYLRTYDGPDMKVARLSESSRRGTISITRYAYLVGRPGQRIQYFEDSDRGLMVEPQRLVRLMGEAGLRARFAPRGLVAGRGLLLGVKPLRDDD